jgi:hypothetical protein
MVAVLSILSAIAAMGSALAAWLTYINLRLTRDVKEVVKNGNSDVSNGTDTGPGDWQVH